MPGVITIGSDYSCVLKGVKNTVSGAALTTATVTFQLYTAAGVAVSGGSGTASYVAASAGTVSDAEFAGTIESTTTLTLTAGALYYVLYVVSASGVDFTFREDLSAQDPGAVIIDAGLWSASTGISLTAGSADETSIERFALAVSEALTRKCYPILLAPRTLTLYAFDAPCNTRTLSLPRPVRSISALYYHAGANGDSSLLDLTADLLTAYTDYRLVIDDVLTGWSRSGEVLRLNQSCWGLINVSPPGRLGYRPEDEPGSLFVSGALGPASVSAAVREAASRAVTLLYTRRKTGMPLQSESFGGYSYSGASQFNAEAAVNSPEVLGLLRDAGVLPIHIG